MNEIKEKRVFFCNQDHKFVFNRDIQGNLTFCEVLWDFVDCSECVHKRW